MSLASRKLIQATAGAAGADTGDDDFANVVLLLDGDGTSGDDNNTFTDSSTNGLTITESGDVVQGSFSPYGDNWSNSFGNNNYYTAASDSSFNIGTGDFTVEAWVNPTQYTTYNYICTMAATGGLTFYVTGGTLKVRRWFVADVLSSSTIPEIGEWTHVAATRSGTTLRIFVNGVQTATTTDSTNYAQGLFAVGNDTNNDAPWYGNISNVRVLKGTALYTSNFTPPTSPLTNITNTSILTAQSNRFVDNSSNGHALTITNTPKVTQFSPFKNDDARDITTDVGSAYLNEDAYTALGAGDGNILPATDDFTIEGWFYHTGLHSGGRSAFFCKDKGSFRDANDGVIISFFENNGTTINNFTATLFKDGVNQSVNNDWPYTFNLFEWYHVAYVRYGSTVELFINGESQGTGTGVTTLEQNNDRTNYIASWRSDKRDELVGYVSDFRIVSSQVYTTDFTPPTSPLTAITNTELLLSFQDAGIYDRSGINNLDTVGNAQIDTAVKKYGTGSMEFDGTGDYLTIPSTQDVALGSGDFTIECWANFSVVGAGNGQGLFQFSNGYLNSQDGRGPGIGISNSNGQWYIYYGAGTNLNTTLGSSPSADTWYHVAFVRTSGVIRIFIDGTQTGSDISYSGNYTDTYLTIGGWYSTSFLFTGYIDDLRITKGVARYTADFTPPTDALPKF